MRGPNKYFNTGQGAALLILLEAALIVCKSNFTRELKRTPAVPLSISHKARPLAYIWQPTRPPQRTPWPNHRGKYLPSWTSFDTPGRAFSANRVEFLTLRNLVNQTHEQPSAVTFPHTSRVYRPPPIGLPRPDLRSRTPVLSSTLPVPLPLRELKSSPLCYFHHPNQSFLHLPLRPYKKKKIRAVKTPARLAVALWSPSCRLSPASPRQTSSHSSLSHRLPGSSPPIGSLVKIIRGKLKSRYRNKTFRVEGKQGNTYTWIRETGIADAERLYKANSSIRVLETRTL